MDYTKKTQMSSSLPAVLSTNSSPNLRQYSAPIVIPKDSHNASYINKSSYRPIYEDSQPSTPASINSSHNQRSSQGYNTIYIPAHSSVSKNKTNYIICSERCKKIYEDYHVLYIGMILLSLFSIVEIIVSVIYLKDHSCNSLLSPALWMTLDSCTKLSCFYIFIINKKGLDKSHRICDLIVYIIMLLYVIVWTVIGCVVIKDKCEGDSVSHLYGFVIASVVINIMALALSFLLKNF